MSSFSRSRDVGEQGSVLQDLEAAEQRIQRIVDATVEPTFTGQDTPHFERHVARLRRVIRLVRQAESIRTISLEKQLGEALNSNAELRNRARSLLSQIPELNPREATRGQGWRTHLKAALRRSSSTESQNTIIDAYTAQALDRTLDSFLLRDLDQLEDVFVEVMSAYNAAVERRNEFQEAEDSASFIAQVVGEARGYRSLDSSDYTAASHPRTTSQKDALADIDLWLAGDTPVYLLTGDIGAGKTSIAYQLCASLHSSPQPSLKLGTSFFFDAENSKSIDLLLSSLAYQARPELRPEILDTVRRCRSTPSAMPNSPFRQMLRDVLTSTPPSQRARTLIVIDGVDQCWSRDEVPDLLQYLLTLVSEFPWLFLFLTIRPRPYIMAALARHSFSYNIYQRYLVEDIQDCAGDVQHYLEHKLKRLRSYDAYLRKHPRALIRLAKHAHGDLTFARVAVNYLARDDPVKAEARFEILFPHRNHNRLAPLDALYLQILQGTIPQPEHPMYQYELMILRSVAVECTTSMSVNSIFTYINAHPAYARSHISLDRIVTAVEGMCSVLKIDLNFEVHAHADTFRDFLLDGKRCIDHRFLVDRPLTLASICLATVTADKPLTEILQPCPCLQSSPPQQRCQGITRHALSLWPRYVSEAAHNKARDAMLIHQLESFVPSPRLALYAWVSTPHQVVDAGKVLMRYLTPDVPTCSEFFKFVSFVHLSRDRRSRSLLSTEAADLMQAIWDMCKEGGGTSLAVTRPDEGTVSLQLTVDGVRSEALLNLSLGVGDVTRYRNIMRNFHAELQDASQEVINFVGLMSGSSRISVSSEDW